MSEQDLRKDFQKCLDDAEARIRADLAEVKSHVTREAGELARAVGEVSKSRPVVTAAILAIGFGAGMLAAVLLR